jgi:hypothetical protein
MLEKSGRNLTGARLSSDAIMFVIVHPVPGNNNLIHNDLLKWKLPEESIILFKLFRSPKLQPGPPLHMGALFWGQSFLGGQ